MLKEGHNKLEGNDKYEGYAVDLIQMIAEEINITYEFRLRNDGNGKRDKKTNKWNGIIGEVQEMVTHYIYNVKLYKRIELLRNILIWFPLFYIKYPIIII